MNTGMTILVMSFLMAGSLFAQVHIRESATIMPVQQMRIYGTGVNDHTLRVQFYWSTQDSGRLSIANEWIYDDFQFDTSVYSGTGSITIEIHQLTANTYGISPSLYFNHSSNIPYSYYVYLDDSLVGTKSGVAVVGNYHYAWYFEPGGEMDFTTPYASGFLLSLGTDALYGEDKTSINLTSVYDGSSNTWSPQNDPVTLTIIDGDQYVSFHRIDRETGTDIRLGSAIATTGTDIGQYFLAADGITPEPDGSWATIQAESNGLTGTASVQILLPVDHFSVHCEPDTIEYSGQAILFVQAKDVYDQDMWYDGNVQISASPSQYGHLDYNEALPGSTVRQDRMKSGKQKMSKVQTSERTTSPAPRDVGGAKKISVDDETIEVGYETAHFGDVFFTADGSLPDSNTTVTFAVASVDRPSAMGSGHLVIAATGPTLVIVYPADELKEKKDIGAEPKMPDITAKAKLENFDGGTVNFEWSLRVQWEGDDGRQFDDPFKGNTSADNSNVSSWTIDWNKMIRGGDEITLDVTASAGGKVYDKTVSHRFEIVGLNPLKPAIKSAITESDPLAIEVIIFMESSWRQFKKDRDFPVWGAPHGYGLMQIDNSPAATDEQVWDWKANLAGGEAHFDSAKSSASALPAEYRARTKLKRTDPRYLSIGYQNATDFSTHEQILKETYQEYNSSSKYWRWKPDRPKDPKSGGHWERRSNTERYADRAWALYINPNGAWDK